MSYRLADLQARRAAVEETLGRVSLELKREAQRAKDAKKRLAKQWLLAGPIRRRVLISYRLAESPQPAVKYLKDVGKRHDWPPKSDAELTSLVNDCFQNAGRDEIVAMVSPEDPSCDKAALQEAVGYVEGWRLVKWTEELNSAKGVAPSNEMVLQRAEHNRLQLPEDLRFATRGTIAENKARKWVRRWRLRWGGRLAKPVCREPLTLDEMRAKAACRGGGTCPGERALVYMRGEGGGWQNRREGRQKTGSFLWTPGGADFQDIVFNVLRAGRFLGPPGGTENDPEVFNRERVLERPAPSSFRRTQCGSGRYITARGFRLGRAF